jgi:hypothetical protein
MLRGNLATRPFFNERVAAGLVGLIATAAVALTAFNVSQLVALSRERSSISARVASERAQAARIRADTAKARQTVDGTALGQLAGSAREANELIDRRTFSWTALFSVIEDTLPYDVRLTAVTPRVDRGILKVSMTVVARRLSDVADFVDALRDTGSFYDTAPIDQRALDDGTFLATVDTAYLAPDRPGPSGTTAPATEGAQ